MIKKSILRLFILFCPFIQGSFSSIKLDELYSKILSFCDLETAINLSLVNSSFNAFVGPVYLKTELQALKNGIDSIQIIQSNCFVNLLRRLDDRIKLSEAPSKYNSENYKGYDLSFIISDNNLNIIEKMQKIIHKIVDKNSVLLPSTNRGRSSDYVSEVLSLPNYTSFYQEHCWRWISRLCCPDFRVTYKISYNKVDLNEKTENHINEVYTNIIDPYFKVRFIRNSPASNCLEPSIDRNLKKLSKTAAIEFVLLEYCLKNLQKKPING